MNRFAGRTVDDVLKAVRRRSGSRRHVEAFFAACANAIREDRLRGELPPSPGLVHRLIVAVNRLFIERVVVDVPSLGGGTSGETAFEVLVHGSTIYPSSAEHKDGYQERDTPYFRPRASCFTSGLSWSEPGLLACRPRVAV